MLPLNRHGGNIPQPADSRLLHASRRAAQISWRVVPYYRYRFGDRGWQYSLADSAWLTTLPACGPQQTLSQIRWLWRVLSNRGMPGWLLEGHLTILHRQLILHAPRKPDVWGRLLDARDDLREERAEVLPLDAFDARALRFAETVGARRHPLIVGTGCILTSAAVDQVLGANRAITSVLSWFTDSARFPPQWCQAVRRAINLNHPP